MSELTPEQKQRRIRIVGKLDDVYGGMTMVYDADTGEVVNNICKIVLTLSADDANYADVSYYTDKGEEQTVVLKDSEVDITAYVRGKRHE